jgi:hypothetical protein
MSGCLFYEVHRKEIQSREVRRDKPPTYVVETPWPGHSGSTIPVDIAKAIGGGKLLKCKSDLQNFQVPIGKRPTPQRADDAPCHN